MNIEDKTEGSVFSLEFDSEGELIASVHQDERGKVDRTLAKEQVSLTDEPLDVTKLVSIKGFEIIHYVDSNGQLQMRCHTRWCHHC